MGEDDYAVPDGASPVYAGSSITKGQLFTLVFAFLLRHCCTEVAAADLLLLLNTVIPGCMPHNLYFFKKLLQPGYSRSVRNSDCYFSVLSRSRTYTLSGIVIVEFCMSTDCNAVHDIRKEVMLIAYPVAETVLQTYDNDLKVNLSAHIRKAVVDYSTVVAIKPTDCLTKLCMVSDNVTNHYLIPVPTFELD